MRLTGEALGTSWRVLFAPPRGQVPLRVREAIEARLARIVGEMSQWEPTSLLSRFNRAAAGDWFELPPDFAHVMATALDVARRSDGAFDPTQGRAAALLGYGATPIARMPDDREMDDARSDAGWSKLGHDLPSGRLRQPGGLWLDLSGIAKGFAVDAVADVLRAAGCEDCLVEIGGELLGRGLKPDGQPWWVDVEAPPGADPMPLRVGLHDFAIATSGHYVRGVHTLEPRTGRPIKHDTISVSVIHRTAMEADAWATALMVLPGGEAIALADGQGLRARIVRQGDGRAVEMLSAALRAMIDD